MKLTLPVLRAGSISTIRLLLGGESGSILVPVTSIVEPPNSCISITSGG